MCCELCVCVRVCVNELCVRELRAVRVCVRVSVRELRELRVSERCV